jgi:hypothetical protein
MLNSEMRIASRHLMRSDIMRRVVIVIVIVIVSSHHLGSIMMRSIMGRRRMQCNATHFRYDYMTIVNPHNINHQSSTIKTKIICINTMSTNSRILLLPTRSMMSNANTVTRPHRQSYSIETSGFPDVRPEVGGKLI